MSMHSRRAQVLVVEETDSNTRLTTLQLLVTNAAGRIEVFEGRAATLTSWELATEGVWSADGSAPIVGASRLYGITADGSLAYVEERTAAGGEPGPYASAVLARIAG